VVIAMGMGVDDAGMMEQLPVENAMVMKQLSVENVKDMDI